MKKKIVWLLVSCLMVLILVLTSCAEAVEEKEEEVVAPPAEEEVVTEEEVIPTEEKETVQDALGRLVEKPRYGGFLIETWGLVPVGFDPAFSSTYSCSTTPMTNEGLVAGDWTKGPSGTGELSYMYNYTPPTEYQVGLLAESWELPDANTLVYHIRKGVRWHDKPPMNGREVVADDIVFGIEYLWTSPPAIYKSYWPYVESMEAIDKYTVVIKCVPGNTNTVHAIAATYTPIMPREVIEENDNMNKWELSCGTGAFMLVDYVTASSATFARNPNYWMKQPFHPEDNVPYIDGIKRLYIPDYSTQMAALRTGRVDMLAIGAAVSLEDSESLMRTNPELKWVVIRHGGQYGFGGKVTTPPYDDVRVRQALLLAIDNEAIARDFYKGQADILNFPVPNVPEYKDAYIPPEELPTHLRELYEYHPDKAKKLLAEAGYPDGFKTEVICMSGAVDLLSIVKDNWAKVGVDMEISVKERTVWVSMVARKSFEHMVWNYVQPGDPSGLGGLAKDVFYNTAMVDDPVIDKYYEDTRTVWPDTAKIMELFREVSLHIIEQAYYVVLPGPFYYAFWQPWVKEYNGESFTGFMGAYGHPAKYLWLDLDLKEEMTGRR